MGMKKMKYFIALALTAVMALLLAACGNSEESGYVMPEWVYVPEFITLDDGDANFYNMQLTGGSLYYISYQYDEEAGRSSQELGKYSLADGQASTIPLKWADEGEHSFNNFYIGEDGSTYCSVYVYSNETVAGEWRPPKVYLYKFDAEGNQVYAIDFADAMGVDNDNFYINTMGVDAQGRVYLSSSSPDNVIGLFDQDGNYAGTVEIDSSISWVSAMGCGKDGKMYLRYYDSGAERGGYVVAEVDFDSKTIGEAYANFPSGNGALVPGIEKDFLVNDTDAVYEYDLETQTKEVLFNWLDSDINGSYVDSFGALDDGRIVAVISDWSSGDNEIALLTKTKSSEVAEKQTIVVGTLFSDTDLKSAAVKFNRSNANYRISIKQYYDYDAGIEYTDAIANLNNDITSSNCPDIIDIYGLNPENLASKGLFADLGEYLDKSSVLNRSDYLENIIDAYTYGDVLISIPYRFMMQTVIGRTSEVGGEIGWTVDDLIAYADAHPDAEVFPNTAKSEILTYMMLYNEDAFIDWATGECSFDSDEFKNLLQFVNRFPDEIDWTQEREATQIRIQNREVLLYPAYIYDFRSIQEYIEVYEGEATCIGYPTMDGSAGCMLVADGLYAITSKSKLKDGAWEFIESYLGQEVDENGWWDGFPSNKAQLQAMMEDAIRVEYVTDENGELYLDENGEPIEIGGGSSVSYYSDSGAGWSYTYHTPTKEEADMIMELINVAKPVSYSANDEIVPIIIEEAEPYFKGQKTVDEVVGIIQSRIKIYVSENS